MRLAGSASWFRIRSSSWKPPLTARSLMTDSFESTYTVPVPGTRKNRVAKYWRSSVERGLNRVPFTLRIQRDRNRVS